jgi:two-component system sensor histidine kinase GlrK
VLIDIADSGRGVAMAERERIFDPFYQGHAPQSSPVRGTGIGLSVARECIQAHGGCIEIVDGIYKGAHFRINLPIDTVQNQD